MREIWKKYKDTNYSVSSLGNVRNDKTNRVLTPRSAGKGYRKVALGRGNDIYIHRLVWDAFNELNGDLVIDHINGNRSDNRLCNLQQITQSKNVRKGAQGKHDLPKYISKKYRDDVIGGCVYFYRNHVDGVRKTLITSVDLDKVIEFKKNFESKAS